MLAVTLAALLQYGSCQSGGPDRSRTAAEVAGAFFEGMTTRKASPIRWVTRRGTVWRSGTSATSDVAFYDQLEADVWPIRRLVVTGMIVNASTVAATTVIRDEPHTESLAVLRIEEGCVTAVQIYGPADGAD